MRLDRLYSIEFFFIFSVKRNTKMVNKRKLKTSASEAESTEGKRIQTDERKEKRIPLDFDENDCDVIITTKEHEVHIPCGFLKLASNGERR